MYCRTLIIALLATLSISWVGAQAQTTKTSLTDTSIVNNGDKTGQFGVGAQVGTHSGVSVDYWYSPRESWNASALTDFGNTAIALAHQWMFPGTFSGSANMLVPYIGAGALMVWGDHSDDLSSRSQSFALAAQVPLGLQLLPPSQRFGIFAELKPSLEISPIAYSFLAADLGARFYF